MAKDPQQAQTAEQEPMDERQLSAVGINELARLAECVCELRDVVNQMSGQVDGRLGGLTTAVVQVGQNLGAQVPLPPPAEDCDWEEGDAAQAALDEVNDPDLDATDPDLDCDEQARKHAERTRRFIVVMRLIAALMPAPEHRSQARRLGGGLREAVRMYPDQALLAARHITRA